MEEYYITLLRHLVFPPLFYSYCLHDPWPTINIRPHIMHFRRLVFSYTE